MEGKSTQLRNIIDLILEYKIYGKYIRAKRKAQENACPNLCFLFLLKHWWDNKTYFFIGNDIDHTFSDGQNGNRK